jgi:hypothetical protein
MTHTNPSDAQPTAIRIPTKRDLDSSEKNTLAALLVRLLADAPLGDMSPDEQRVAFLVETRFF